MNWDDPAYVAAKRANAAAYANFCTVAASNPYRFGQPEQLEFYEQIVLPAKAAWIEALGTLKAETAGILGDWGLGA